MKASGKHHFWRVGFTMIAALLVFGMGIETSNADEQVLIGTASIGASFYPTGCGMAEVINRHLPGYRAICQATGGSVANLRLLNDRKITIGFSADIFGKAAHKGVKPFKKKLNVAAFLHLGFFPTQFSTLKKTGIKTVYDMKNKRISFGPPGSSQNATVEEVLKLHGISKDDVKPYYMGYSEGIDALSDGVIDVAVDPGVQPSPATEQLFSIRDDAVLITGDPEIIKAGKSAGKVLYKVPKGMYKGVDYDVYDIALWGLAYVNAEEKDKVVYDTIKTILAHKDYLKTVHPLGAQVDWLRKKVVDEHGLRVHPGAVKAAKDMGEWEK